MDQNSGDGILVESEGADYARYSQYIPNARAIIQQSEQTQAEQKLHSLFRNIAEQIANDLHNGKTSFCLQDYMEKTDLEELIRGSVRELLDRRADIQQVQDVSLDVPFQPDFQITAKPVQELKFYCPLTIRREPDYDEEYDYGEEYPEIPSSAAAGYADTVQKRLEGYCSDDGKRGLMEYYDREKSVSEKVYSAVPSVTVRDGELVGMYICQVHGELNSKDLEEFRDYLIGQSSDGVGEGFEQREIRTAEYGNIYVSFWNYSDEWSLLTEEELEPQEMEESMDMRL